VVELAEIFRDAGPAYLQRFGDRMLPSHLRVLRNIIACRTPALGGQMYFCHRCDLEHSVYFSCRDRHCPKCQGYEGEKWLEKQRKLLLPCSYGFATFTVPAGLREVTRSHQLVTYPILIRAAARAVLEVAGNRRIRSPTGASLSQVRRRVRESSRRYPQGKGTAMTIIVLRCFVIRTCGSGKLCADPKSVVSSASLPPMYFTRSRVFGHLEGLPAPFFGASPYRFTRRIPSALD